MSHPFFLRLPALLALFLIPGALFSQPAETMPTTIPDEIVADWKKQDGSDYALAIMKIKNSLPNEYASKIIGTSSETDYLVACHWRRVAKLKPYLGNIKKVLYAKHYNLGGGSAPGYLSGLPDDHGNMWAVGSGLYILTMDNYYPQPEPLIVDSQEIIKDHASHLTAKKWFSPGQRTAMEADFIFSKLM